VSTSLPLHRLLTTLALAFVLCSSVLHAAPGALDVSFGIGGKASAVTTSNDDYGNAVVLQPDGKIVIAGQCPNGTKFDFCLVRYTANATSGQLDATFGTNGLVVTAFGAGSAIAKAAAQQADGKIVLAGNCSNGSTIDFCMARYHSGNVPGFAAGTLDLTFASSGKLFTAIGTGDDFANAMMIQPDGKIVLAGYCVVAGNNNFCAARYLANGSLDNSFNGSGKVTTAVGTLGNDKANAIALQSNGAIVLAGSCRNGSNFDFCALRYQPNGAVDGSFGGTGKVLTSVSAGADVAFGTSIQPDGKILLAGTCSSAGNQFCLLRYNADGTLDLGLNGIGTVITAVTASGDDSAAAMALQPDGKILLAGSCVGASNLDFCALRYQGDGTIDTSFGTAGKVVTPISTFLDLASAIALQPDGKIIVVGSCYNTGTADFCALRYEGGPYDAQNCKPDIDGDGHFFATTDALIYTRIALGLTGSAVVNGITFPPTATRNTWPLIRDYLVTQCGMSLVQ
jgi:uncharacterized delta-60 repeat protein